MTKMKGFFKGFKFISQIFVIKEHEMEIGYPSDVKHVAHIGWDGNTILNSPSWMNDFNRATSEFPSTPGSSFHRSGETFWATPSLDQKMPTKKQCGGPMELPSLITPKGSWKEKQKKNRVTSPVSSARSSTKSSKSRASCEKRTDGFYEHIKVT